MKENKFRNRFFQFLLSYHKLLLVLSLLIATFLFFLIPKIKTDFTARVWHQEDSPEIQEINRYEEYFGGDEIFILGVDFKNNIFNADNIDQVKKLTQQLGNLPDVTRVNSLANFNDIKFSEGQIEITHLIPEYTSSLKLVEQRADQIEEIQNVLVNKNKNFVLFFIQLKPSFGKNPDYGPYTKALTELMTNSFKEGEIQWYPLGNVAIANAFKEVAVSDNLLLLPILFSLIALLLLLYFRSFLGVFIPLSIAFISVGESLGFMALMGYKLSNITASISGILLSICLAESIHLITIFYQKRDENFSLKDSLLYSLHYNFTPTLLTSLTTAISFLSITNTELLPIFQLGITTAFGVLIAWINTYILVPSLILLTPHILHKKFIPGKRFLQIDLTQFIVKNSRSITIVFVIATITSLVLSFKNEANSDPLNYFSPKTKIRTDYDFAESQLGSLRMLNVVIDSGSTDAAKNAQFLKTVDSFITEIKGFPFVLKVNSVVTTLKKLHQNINNNDEKFFSIPDTKEKVAELLLLYSLGTPTGSGLESFISHDHRYLNIEIRWQVTDMNDSIKKNALIQNVAKKYNLNAKASGTFALFAGVNDKVISTFFGSIWIDLLTITLILYLVFRSFTYCILAIIPNVVPLLFVGAYTAVSKIYIDAGACIVFSICLGIAIDDTVHFMTHYVPNLKKSHSVTEALKLTYLQTGEAINLTSLILIMSFSSFMFADFLPNQNFGILSSLVLFFALIADLLFLPAILVLLPHKRKN
jgi:predicted RND superfamily exporter protein